MNLITIFFLILVSFANHSFAIIPGEGASTTMAVKAQTLMQKAEFQLMRIELVKQTKALYDNYIQTKRYYDAINEASKNRGGLLGYYADRFMNRINNAAQEEWWRLQQLKEGSEDNDVRRAVEKGEAFISKKIDETGDKWIDSLDKEMAQMVDIVNGNQKAIKERDVQLAKLVADSSQPGITDKKHDSLMLQAQILQLEYLSSIEKQNQSLFAEEVRQIQREMKLVKRNQMISKDLSRAMSGALDKKNKGDMKYGKMTEAQVIKVLSEPPK